MNDQQDELLYHNACWLTVEEAQNVDLIEEYQNRLVHALLVRLVTDRRKPVLGTVQFRAEREEHPGEVLPQAWWRRLLRLTPPRGPAVVRFVLRVSLVAVPEEAA